MAKAASRAMAAAALAAGLWSVQAVAQEPAAGAPPTVERSAAEAAPAAAVAAPHEAGTVPAQKPTEAALPPIAAKKPHDLTPMGMFLAADPIVQCVMILLAAASVATWTVLLVKGFSLLMAKRRMRAAIRTIREAETLSDATAKVGRGIARRLLTETDDEVMLSRGLPNEGIKERVQIALQRVEMASARSMAVGTGVLATVGSIGPFVGLFGTVWGIMRSFIGIAQSNTTNLAVVAPGIAEALLATGIGLVAAIPAVVIYNVLTRAIGGYRAMTGDAVALIMRHLSRELDRKEVRPYGQSFAAVRLAAE